MAPKRKKHAEPEDDTMDEFAKPVYLVALHEDAQKQSAYSVFKIDAAAAGGDEPLRVRTVVAGLAGTKRGMSFVTAHSQHGSWIVGVGGGPRSATIIFDPKTLKTFDGPKLVYPKHEPILISHGNNIYAISRRPRVVGAFDFDPWFISLTFRKGVPCNETRVYVSWRNLTPPPFFPSFLDPYQFRNPPQILVSSYAAVGSHILISAEQDEQPVGTYAFHVKEKTWAKVCDKNLPFVGHAMPLAGGSLFAANNDDGSVSVFHMSIKASSLLIHEFPIAASECKIPPRPLVFCPLGEGSFCSIRWPNSSMEEVQVILTAFQANNIEAILTACQSQSLDAKDLRVAVQVKEQSHTYISKGRFHQPDSDMPVVAALSM